MTWALRQKCSSILQGNIPALDFRFRFKKSDGIVDAISPMQMSASANRGIAKRMPWIGHNNPVASLIQKIGWLSLWYLIPARIAFGARYFGLRCLLHGRGKAYGVYPLVLPIGLRRAANMFLGAAVVEAMSHHDVHHASPRIAAINLRGCRPSVTLQLDLHALNEEAAC